MALDICMVHKHRRNNLLAATCQNIRCSLGCPKNIKNVIFCPIFCIRLPKPKEFKSFQTFVLRGRAFSFYKGNPKNIQRKICIRTVSAVISHITVQSNLFLDQSCYICKDASVDTHCDATYVRHLSSLTSNI